jgi:hypothetical protein
VDWVPVLPHIEVSTWLFPRSSGTCLTYRLVAGSTSLQTWWQTGWAGGRNPGCVVSVNECSLEGTTLVQVHVANKNCNIQLLNLKDRQHPCCYMYLCKPSHQERDYCCRECQKRAWSTYATALRKPLHVLLRRQGGVVDNEYAEFCLTHFPLDI